jgi:hypothetical protein
MITDTALHRYRHYHAPGVRLSSLAWRVNWIGARRSCGLSQTADVANAVAGVAKKPLDPVEESGQPFGIEARREIAPGKILKRAPLKLAK